MKLVHQVRHFSFDSDNGDKIEGCIINYLEEQEEQGNNRGFASVSINGDVSLLPKVKEVPAYYDLDLGVVSKKGKASLKLNDLKFVKPLQEVK